MWNKCCQSFSDEGKLWWHGAREWWVTEVFGFPNTSKVVGLKLEKPKHVSMTRAVYQWLLVHPRLSLFVTFWLGACINTQCEVRMLRLCTCRKGFVVCLRHFTHPFSVRNGMECARALSRTRLVLSLVTCSSRGDALRVLLVHVLRLELVTSSCSMERCSKCSWHPLFLERGGGKAMKCLSLYKWFMQCHYELPGWSCQ